MLINGSGVLKAPGTSRVIHDFANGPFSTTNPLIIAEARRRGLMVGNDVPVVVPVKKPKKKKGARK
jgi:hypothetical protein